MVRTAYESGAGEELQERIVEFLSEVEYSELITVKDGVPHTRPMVYANKGMTIYMVSKKNATKIEHIKGNPHVSVLIIKSFQKSETIKEITLEGKGFIVESSEERNEAFKLFEAKPKVFQFWAGKTDMDEYDVIRIEPRLIKYFDYSKEDGAPLVLEV